MNSPDVDSPEKTPPPGPPAERPAPAPPAGEPAGPRLRELLEALAIAIVFALFVRTFVFQAFQIPSGSMEDNLQIGDHILVNKFVYAPRLTRLEEWVLPMRDPRRGDVVVFKFPDDPGRDFIKRCVAGPGDEVEIVDKQLFVNGTPAREEGYKQHLDPRIYSRSVYVAEARRRRDNFGPFLVPPDNWFCLGDSRDNSEDSRFWNRTTVPRDYLKGRAMLIYWSLEPRRADAPRFPGTPLERAEQQVTDFFERIRTERHFRQVR